MRGEKPNDVITDDITQPETSPIEECLAAFDDPSGVRVSL